MPTGELSLEWNVTSEVIILKRLPLNYCLFFATSTKNLPMGFKL